MDWVQFSSQEELQNALQEPHIIDGIKVSISAVCPMSLLTVVGVL